MKKFLVFFAVWMIGHTLLLNYVGDKGLAMSLFGSLMYLYSAVETKIWG